MIGLVAMMNVVNFSDGVDGLAAGVCAIVAIAFAVIAFNLNEKDAGGVLAAITAGARARLPRSTTSRRRRASWATRARTCSAC